MRASGTPRAETLVSRWLGVSRQLRRQMAERYAAAGLSETRATLLLHLCCRVAPPSQAQLAEELGQSPSSLCELIERLRLEGLLRCERSALDRRQSVLLLTETGERACEVITGIQKQFEEEVRERLPADLLLALPELLDGLQGVWSGKAAEHSAGRVA